MIKKFYSGETPLVCKFPKECPICKSKIEPIHNGDVLNKDIDLVSILFTCPSCGKGFISHYHFEAHVTTELDEIPYFGLDYRDSYPKVPNKIEFDKQIHKVSPNFCEIYNQANSAEVYELNQISGIGYRKALEFLVKDYCIYKNPDNEKTIKSNFLSKVIEDYIDSDKIKNLSKAATWIGNDETHYIRKFEDKDINDLKRFISATVAFITYDLISEEATDLISSK